MFSEGKLEACMHVWHTPPTYFSLFRLSHVLALQIYKYRLFFSKKGSFAPPNHTVDILFKVALAH